MIANVRTNSSLVGVFPVLPQPGNAERRAVLHGDREWLFCLLPLDCLPLEEAIGRMQCRRAWASRFGRRAGARRTSTDREGRSHTWVISSGVRPSRAGVGACWSTRTRSTRITSFRTRSEEHTSELQSPYDIVCSLLLEKT